MKSEYAMSFIQYLERLTPQGQNKGNPGALARLRHSLAFAPGAYPAAYPYVEPFLKLEWEAQDKRRLACYLVAGLYAKHPQQAEQSLASALGVLWSHKEKSPSIEQRFVALLGTDASSLADHLRQSISLLASADIGLNYGELLDDLFIWMNPAFDLDRIRQRWAREFYRAAYRETEANNTSNSHA